MDKQKSQYSEAKQSSYSRCFEREADCNACIMGDDTLNTDCVNGLMETFKECQKFNNVLAQLPLDKKDIAVMLENTDHPPLAKRVTYLKQLKKLAGRDGKVDKDTLRTFIRDCPDCKTTLEAAAAYYS